MEVDRRIDDLRTRLELVIHHGQPGVRAFFNEENGFAGATFHQLGRKQGSADNRPERITEADLLAVTLLDVPVPPSTVRRLLGEEGKVIASELGRVPFDHIWNEPGVPAKITDWGEGGDIQGAWSAWRRLRECEGVDHVVACKILARLRPELIPVRDSVTDLVLGLEADENDWLLFGRALSDEGLRFRAEALRDEVEVGWLPLLRVIDAATWMLGGKSKRVRRALGRAPRGAKSRIEPQPGFLDSRSEFWSGHPDTDPLDR